jgi:hypothetical protein
MNRAILWTLSPSPSPLPFSLKNLDKKNSQEIHPPLVTPCRAHLPATSVTAVRAAPVQSSATEKEVGTNLCCRTGTARLQNSMIWTVENPGAAPVNRRLEQLTEDKQCGSVGANGRVNAAKLGQRRSLGSAVHFCGAVASRGSSVTQIKGFG